MMDVEELRALQNRQMHLLDELAAHARLLEVEVEELKRSESQLLFDAQHDGLTRLNSRAFLLQRLHGALSWGSGACSVLMLDLDRFKLVNDGLGHAAGDTLLRRVADRLLTCVRPEDTLARLGGDEFVVLVEDGGLPGIAEAVALRIADAMRQPFWLGEQDVLSSCSVGVVHASALYGSPEAVLRDADIAMYHAKRRGQAGFAVFDAAMHEEAVETTRLRMDLRDAIPSRELFLHYQPVCEASTGRVVGAEALVRWQHPRHGVVMPPSFVPVAEETGLICEVGRWVLREACCQLRAWQDQFPASRLRVGVNVSAAELTDRSFVSGVRAILAETGADPASLQVEVTGSAFLPRPEAGVAVLDGLCGLGVRVALDDFGAGYSSLSCLDRCRIDTAKIGRSFVARLYERPRSLAVVQAMLHIGEVLGLEVVAKGVEEEEELRALQAVGCKLMQGFLLGRPVPASIVTARLARQRKGSAVRDRAV